MRQAYTRTRWASIFLMGFAVTSALGCADDGPGAPAGLDPLGPSAVGDGSLLDRACVEGATRACHLVLGEHGGVISCYEGTETCTGGAFGPCADGATFEVNRSDLENASSDRGGASLRPLSFSAATACTDNPCNRYCQEFDEAPAAGLTAELDDSAPPLSSWTTGSVSDYAPEWLVVGVREPCHVAGDCQLNTECTDPALGSCSHSVCDSGGALEVGCNRCADTVCAIDTTCCGTPLECAHDPCEVGSGAYLDRTCDTCVAAVCDVHPECCEVTWDAACVGYVATECAPLGQSCGCPERSVENAGSCYLVGDQPRDFGLSTDACRVFGENTWTLIEVNDASENAIAQGFITSEGMESAWLGGNEFSVDNWEWQSTAGEVFFISDATGGAVQPPYTYANWASGEPELGVAGRVILMSADGSWQDADRTTEHDFICEGPPNRLTPRQTAFSWSESCVGLALTECGVQCPDGGALGLGSCNPRVATALDPECASFDLALGATCEDGGVPQIPVCNHGQLAAPAGLRLTHVDSGDFGKDTPSLADAVDCVLSEPIPPGRCVTVTDCPGLTADRALVVNPVDGTEDSAECRLDDNWTIYQPVTCRPALCEAALYDARQLQRNGCSVPVQHPLTIDTTEAVVTLGTGVPEPSCAAGEIRWGASCYFFSNDVQTWDAAQDRCQDRGAGWDLVALNTPAENTWVRSGTSPLEDVQIGLNDKLVEGAHSWSNGTCTSWSNWDTTTLQPNDFLGGGEQCVRMTVASGDKWEDKACNDGEHPYVCEGPVLDAQGGCAAGQSAGPDGSCYAFDATPRTWSESRDLCSDMGPGWALVAINEETTNDFVSASISCTPTWLQNPPSIPSLPFGEFTNWAPAESVDLSQDPYIDELGLWHASDTALSRATLCQGPATATGAPVLSQVAGLASCTNDSQYYFEGSAFAPERLALCPDTCTRAASVPDRRIDVEIPCAPPTPPAIETTIAELYYESTCEGGGAIWDFFYYDAVTPADSRIEFEIRTAPSIAQLAADTIPFVPIAAAHAVPTDTQQCDVDPPDCPIDIFTALGTTGQQQSKLELLVRLIPGSSGEGPLLRDWKVRFSCPPSQ